MQGKAVGAGNAESVDYPYHHAACGCAHRYLLPAVEDVIRGHTSGAATSILDLGCGNGSVVARLASLGHDVVGVEPSTQGVEEARRAYPKLRIHQGSAYDDLASELGQFPIVVSLEVVEHVYYPRKFAACVHDLLRPDGLAIVSTPYHGYLKNVAIAVSGKFDSHMSPLWTHGHIKFWSRSTLRKLLEASGLQVERFLRVGRIPPLAKSMIALARRSAP